MTDEQIVMLMERCYKKEESVVIVQFNSDDTKTEITLDDILGVVNRKQAEIERLQKELSAKMPSEEYPFKVKVGNNSEIHSKSIEDYDRLLIDISAETIKEFAKELKSEIVNKPSEFSAEKGTVDFLNGLAHRQHEILNDIDRVINRKAGEG